jgi:anti-sigma regulatory factor (Ser/Thr protein kinase)
MRGGDVDGISIEMSGNIYFVPIIRTAIGQIACEYGFNEQEVYEIVTIVDELCNNAVEHGSKGNNKKISIYCKFDDCSLEMTIKDSGSPGFDPQKVLQQLKKLMEEEIAKPKLDVIRRQRGLLMVQHFADKLDISSSPNGTVVKIEKKGHAGKSA